jgi:hypothetical protein
MAIPASQTFFAEKLSATGTFGQHILLFAATTALVSAVRHSSFAS